MTKSFDDLAAELKQIVLSQIRNGGIRLADPQAQAKEKAAHAAEVADHRRQSMAKAQAIRLTRKTKLETSRYYGQHENTKNLQSDFDAGAEATKQNLNKPLTGQKRDTIT